jgi:hypothetical protein
MDRRCWSLIALVITVWALMLRAQWIPVTARIREMQIVTKNGATVQQVTREGYFYRTSAGSTLTQWLDPSGAPKSGILLDNQRLGLYRLSYQGRTALQVKALSNSRVGPGMQGTPAIATETTIEGIPCGYVPNYLGKDKTQIIGQSCFSGDGLELTNDVSIPSAGGGVVTRSVTRLYEIRLHQEPSAALFDLSQFTLSGADTPSCQQQTAAAQHSTQTKNSPSSCGEKGQLHAAVRR